MTINPNKAYEKIFYQSDLSNPKVYPKFILGAEFENFRHISKLELKFATPITVISGSNKTGKTTVLLSIACSHFDFKKRNYTNGNLERQTWSNVIKITSHDNQINDWTYYLTIKTGGKTERKRGQRKKATKKWNGLGKKESQIEDNDVVYLDLDRILPARHFSPVLHKKAKHSTGSMISASNQTFIEECLSYILEETYSVKKLAAHLGKDLLGFSAGNDYSSYNSASGEDALSRIIIDCIEAPKHSLILIDELELGLHPKIQRRLMDVIFEISQKDEKQFILTTHSPTILSCVPDFARVFIDSKNGLFKSVSPISINSVLSKMDSKSYPLIDIFCEDACSEKIIKKALKEIESRNIPGISAKLINIIISGTADQTHQNFIVRDRIYEKVSIRSGHACILDGDMSQNHKFVHQDGLFFLPGISAPEKFLCDIYESKNKNRELRYHIDNSNPHCLFDKMIEYSEAVDQDTAFELCWSEVEKSDHWKSEFNRLTEFIIKECQKYSPDL